MRMMIVWDRSQSEVIFVPETKDEAEIIERLDKITQVSIRPCKLRDDENSHMVGNKITNCWRIFLDLTKK